LKFIFSLCLGVKLLCPHEYIKREKEDCTQSNKSVGHTMSEQKYNLKVNIKILLGPIYFQHKSSEIILCESRF
jgi:hypothetical protein